MYHLKLRFSGSTGTYLLECNNINSRIKRGMFEVNNRSTIHRSGVGVFTFPFFAYFKHVCCIGLKLNIEN